MARLPLTRRGLLAGAGAVAAGAFVPRGVRASRPRRLVQVVADGGWDVSYCLDPKLGLDSVDGPEQDEDPAVEADREEVVDFGGIPIVVNDHKRPAVSAFFARWHERCAVINGVSMGSVGHVSARTRLLTGTTDASNPGWATIAGSRLGGDRILGLVDLSGRSYLGALGAASGQVGATGQLRTLVDPASRFPPADGAPPPALDPAAHEALDAWLSRRTAAFAEHVPGAGAGAGSYATARLEALDRASRLRRDGPALLGGLVPGVPVDFPTQVELAAQLLGDDLCAVVSLDSRIDWDTHADNFAQHAAYEGLFQVLDLLASELDARGLLDDTLVAVVSEFTRTPLVTAGGGKNHWPFGSALLLGGPAVGGRVYGGTDELLQGLAVDPGTGRPDPAGEELAYDHLAAGILAGLDVDPAEFFPGVRPFLAPFGG